MTTTTERVDQAIADAVKVSLPQIKTIDFDAVLTSDVGLDSVQIMDLVMEIEDRLDLSIPVEVLADVQTLGELSRHLQKMIED